MDDGLILSIPKDPKIWSHTTTVGVNNPALLAHPDGRFFLYYKAMKKGDVRRMGVAIADSVEGPYLFQPKPLTSNQSEIEDGYAFFENDQVHLLTTYNKAKAGYLWSSNDGLDFSSPMMGFDVMQKYIDPAVVKAATNFRGRKFERPQVLMKDAKATWLYVASGANVNQGNGSCSYVLKINEAKKERMRCVFCRGNQKVISVLHEITSLVSPLLTCFSIKSDWGKNGSGFLSLSVVDVSGHAIYPRWQVLRR